MADVMHSPPTVDEVRRKFFYDTETGKMVWRDCHYKSRNARAKGRNGPRGVTPRGSRWQAQIRADGRNHYLGLFPTKEEAHRAYVNAAKELHGEFARS